MPRPTDVMSQQDFGRLVAYLNRMGLSPARRVVAVGDGPRGRLVREITLSLRAELKRSPKAQ